MKQSVLNLFLLAVLSVSLVNRNSFAGKDGDYEAVPAQNNPLVAIVRNFHPKFSENLIDAELVAKLQESLEKNFRLFKILRLHSTN